MDRTTDSPTSLGDERLRSPEWRLNNLYWITNKRGERVKFRMNWAQLAFYRSMWFLCCILKARQLGFSTFILIFILDRMLFNSNVRAGVIAHNKDDAKVLFRDKIKYAYDNLPEWLRAARPATKNDAGELMLANNSSVRVGTSMRSGTLQYLHISEYGKICAKYPEKAEEIRTGALNAVAAGCFVFEESTAEGAHGDFADTYANAAQRVEHGLPRTAMDFEPYFYPWWKEPSYTLEADGELVVSDRLERYFRTLKATHGIELTDGQKRWYAKKRQSQGTKMMREFPSTPDEAFEQPIEGAYFADDMIEASEAGRILTFAPSTRLPVNTFWDLGLRATDTTCIWFHQRVGLQDHFIDFHEDHGKGLDSYIRLIRDKGYLYGKHYLPHDIRVREIGNEAKPRYTVLEEAAIGEVEIVERTESVADSIERIRTVLPNCVFHAEHCKDGLAALRAYRREYDEKLEVWRSTPLHDWASNPTDAFRTYADGYEAPSVTKSRSRKRRAGGGSIATV